MSGSDCISDKWGREARLDSKHSCHEPCPRVDQFIHSGSTHPARGDLQKGPFHSEEFCQMLATLIHGEASSRARQFAQRLRDTADEELVAPLETFAAAVHREPHLAGGCRRGGGS